MTQEKMRKIIAACVSAATVLFVLLFTYLVYQWVTLAVLDRREKELQAETKPKAMQWSDTIVIHFLHFPACSPGCTVLNYTGNHYLEVSYGLEISTDAPLYCRAWLPASAVHYHGPVSGQPHTGQCGRYL